MNWRLPAALAGTGLAIALTASSAAIGFSRQALAQGVFPPPPPPGSTGFVTGPASGTTGEVQGFRSQTEPPGGPQGGPQGGPPPGSVQAKCNVFLKLSAEAKSKADLIRAGMKEHVDRKDMCGRVSRFYDAESTVVKFLVDNKTLCGVPDEAIKNSKASHDQSLKFRDNVCAEGPQAKKPSLSDAIGTPTLDTEKNTKTGKNAGTFDTLTGNPLGR